MVVDELGGRFHSLRETGGEERTTMGWDGQIVSKDTVSHGNDLRSSKDTGH